MPNIIGRNKSSILGYLKEKVHSRIKSWDGKSISRSGNEVLIKNVVQALPTFAMSVFLLPLEITKDIERRLTKFWWSSSSSRDAKISWMSWERMANHKVSGGMGFRHFRDFNIAMLAKQGWRLVTCPDRLVTKAYKARYFENTDFLQAKLGSNPSFIWRSILEAQKMLKDGRKWRVGVGDRVEVLGQPWLVDNNNPYITTASPAIEKTTVNSLICVDKKEWDVDLICDIFNERDQRCILNVPLKESSCEDLPFWLWENNGIYSVKSGYKLLQAQKNEWRLSDDAGIWKTLWRIKAPPKTLNLVWRALAFCLPTLVQLQQKHVNV